MPLASRNVPLRAPASPAQAVRGEVSEGGQSPPPSYLARSQASHAPNGYGAREALERQRIQLLRVDHALDSGRHASRDEDLPSLGLSAQPRREVRDRTDRAVVHAAFQADGADGGVALRDADTEREVPAAFSPPRGEAGGAVPHGDGHAERSLGCVRNLDRIVE